MACHPTNSEEGPGLASWIASFLGQHQTFFVPGAGVIEIAEYRGQDAASKQGHASDFGRSFGATRQVERSLQPTHAFLEVVVEEPERPERARLTQRGTRVALGDVPIERQPEVR